jgi:hypothetical protein
LGEEQYERILKEEGVDLIVYTKYRHIRLGEITSPWEFRWIVEGIFNISNPEDLIETLNEYLFYDGYKIKIVEDDEDEEEDYDYI